VGSHWRGQAAPDKRRGLMKTSIRTSGDVAILDLKGKITIGEGDVALRENIEKLLEDGKKQIILNLAKVNYMDSSGVGELVGTFTTVNNRGGKMKLLNLTEKIQDLLQITQLLTVFECFSDEAEAVASFS
jgi:anti-sigma B factor antagonist